MVDPPKRGRPLLEGEPMDVILRVRITRSMAEAVDAKRGADSHAAWLRRLIKKELK